MSFNANAHGHSISPSYAPHPPPQASRITQAVARACTQAYQDHQKKRQASVRGPAPSGGPPVGMAEDEVAEMRRQSQARAVSSSLLHKRKSCPFAFPPTHTILSQSMRPRSTPGGSLPKLTDAWFRPSMSRGEVCSR